MQDARNSWECLTGLKLDCRVKAPVRDREFIEQIPEVWREVVQSVGEAFRGGVSAWAMLNWERTLGQKLRELGRLIVEYVVNRIEPEDERELSQHERFDGEFYRRKKKSPLRNLNCTFGRIELRRCLYQPLETSGRCLFPLERRLGIVGGVATPALADAAAHAAADQPQRQVLNGLKERHGVSWSAQTL